MNPRLSTDWLRYLVTVGARRDEDGWRWKIDPTMRFGGFGPWRPEWSMMRLPGVGVPVLAILGTEPDPLGWGTTREDVESHLPPQGRLLRLRHNKVDLALHQLRDGDGPALLHLHGLGERSPAAVPGALAAWPGPVWALDLTGHGESGIPVGGGYFCEVLMGDVDAALAHLGPATLFGRGLGAYVGLLAAGGRPELVRGAICADGPGLAGGGPVPGSPWIPRSRPVATETPDPMALVELTRDIRPPDYAASFARQAVAGSGLDPAVAVCAVARPPWLEAVAQEPGVADCTLSEALSALGGLRPPPAG
jgi:pimeloyl-ACP methyl ester carboxylesterase